MMGYHVWGGASRLLLACIAAAMLASEACGRHPSEGILKAGGMVGKSSKGGGFFPPCCSSWRGGGLVTRLRGGYISNAERWESVGFDLRPDLGPNDNINVGIPFH